MEKKEKEAESAEAPPSYDEYLQSETQPMQIFSPPSYNPPFQPQDGYAVTHQPVAGSGAQQTHVIVIRNVCLENPPPTYLTMAIFVTLCCCFSIGIFAIVRASSCKNAIGRGDRNEATKYSKEAKALSMWALGVGIVLNVLSLALFVTFFALDFIPAMTWYQ